MPNLLRTYFLFRPTVFISLGGFADFANAQTYRPIAMFAVEFKAGEANASMMELFARSNYGKSGGVDDAAE